MIQKQVMNSMEIGIRWVLLGASFAFSLGACQFHEPKKNRQDRYQKELYSRSGKGNRWSHNRQCWYKSLVDAVTYFENTGKAQTFIESLEHLPNSLANQCINNDGLTLLTQALTAGCLDTFEGMILIQDLLSSGVRLFGPCAQAFYLGRDTPFYQLQKNLTDFLQEIDSDSDYLRNWRHPCTGGTLLHLYAQWGDDLPKTLYKSLFEDIYFLMDRLKLDPLVKDNDGKTYQNYISKRGLLANQPILTAVAIKTIQKRARSSCVDRIDLTAQGYDPSVIESGTGKILRSCVIGPVQKIETYRPRSPIFGVQVVSSHKRQKSVIKDVIIPADIHTEMPAHQGEVLDPLFPGSPVSDTSIESDLFDKEYDARVSSILDIASQVLDSEDELLSSLPDFSDFDFEDMALSVTPEDEDLLISSFSQSPPPLKISDNLFRNEARTPESNPEMFMVDRRQDKLIPRSLWPEKGEVV